MDKKMMKIRNILFLTFLAAMLMSCERFIELSEEGPENLLAVNGELMAGDTLHTVYLGMSRFNSLKKVSTAHLDCYVNDEKVSSADNPVSWERYPKSFVKCLKFKAKIKPGDNVRLEIEADGEKVEVSCTAPQPASITSVDTATVMRASDDGDEMQKKTHYYVTLKDRPGEADYYRITAAYEGTVFVGKTSEHYTEHRTGDKLFGDFRYIALDNTSEPLLNKKIRLGMEDGDTGNNYYDNEYNIFTDNTFADGKYTLSLYSSYIKYLRPLPSESFGYSPQDYTPMRKGKVIIRLLSMDRDTYNYINDYEFDASEQSGWMFFPEIPYPSNVSGGTGLVSVVTPYDYEIVLPEGEYY